eukprot:9347904-Pyramimonas_sp.AAC.1
MAQPIYVDDSPPQSQPPQQTEPAVSKAVAPAVPVRAPPMAAAAPPVKAGAAPPAKASSEAVSFKAPPKQPPAVRTLARIGDALEAFQQHDQIRMSILDGQAVEQIESDELFRRQRQLQQVQQQQQLQVAPVNISEPAGENTEDPGPSKLESSSQPSAFVFPFQNPWEQTCLGTLGGISGFPSG